MVGEQSVIIGVALFTLYCCPAHEKLEMAIVRVVRKKFYQVYKGKLGKKS